ncbi:MAG: hypothetical protein M3Z37_04115 [Candidatus Eremiobacteraeota bacterium]|nr:hypothetical protein [Candidatus Eremiobacteraeota bacterium]
MLPAGLPKGSTLLSLARAGSSAILLQYNLPGAWRRDNHVLALVLANPQSFAATSKSMPGDYLLDLSGGTTHRGVHWTIGHEDVILAGSTLTPAELAHIKSAMLAQVRQR